MDWTVWQRDLRSDLLDVDAAAGVVETILRCPFLIEAHPAQRPPPGRWRNWLFLGGRGAGKTRAGAEWVSFAAHQGHAERIALVGASLQDVREIMIEGESGLKRICPPHGVTRPVYESSRRRLVFDNGAEAYAFSAEDPDSLRGPQFHLAWCDELAAWPHGGAAWHQVQLSLRLGIDPRALVTTTPRPIELLRSLLADGDTVTTHAPTSANAENLAPGFLERVAAQLPSGDLIQQELYGAVLEAEQGALWRRDSLEACRSHAVPQVFETIIVAIDPPATSGLRADMCGIIAAGRSAGAGEGALCHILADASFQGGSPLEWAGRAIETARQCEAVSIVAEANQGGEMVRQVLLAAGCTLPIRLVHARLGKVARAQPVSALYRQGRIRHVGQFDALESQMLTFGSDGMKGSPDRVDALVWAVWALMIDGEEAPRMRVL